METINFVGELQKLDLGPSDILVLHCDEYMSDKTVTRIRELLTGKFPGHEVLVLGRGMKLGVIAKAA